MKKLSYTKDTNINNNIMQSSYFKILLNNMKKKYNNVFKVINYDEESLKSDMIALIPKSISKLNNSINFKYIETTILNKIRSKYKKFKIKKISNNNKIILPSIKPQHPIITINHSENITPNSNQQVEIKHKEITKEQNNNDNIIKKNFTKEDNLDNKENKILNLKNEIEKNINNGNSSLEDKIKIKILKRSLLQEKAIENLRNILHSENYDEKKDEKKYRELIDKDYELFLEKEKQEKIKKREKIVNYKNILDEQIKQKQKIIMENNKDIEFFRNFDILD